MSNGLASEPPSAGGRSDREGGWESGRTYQLLHISASRQEVGRRGAVCLGVTIMTVGVNLRVADLNKVTRVGCGRAVTVWAGPASARPARTSAALKDHVRVRGNRGRGETREGGGPWPCVRGSHVLASGNARRFLLRVRGGRGRASEARVRSPQGSNHSGLATSWERQRVVRLLPVTFSVVLA